ncbi:branched-chain amino acid ABC transporter permease [Candidatus Poriferisocius sp.]|uniref:branched-chain amino acid ABC transporter permease n=1 Tax=Candidatus Poriferisocius sp. TaxID=3101276 RepID=UPI003B5B7D8E
MRATAVVAGSRSHRRRQMVGWTLFLLAVVLIPFLIADTYSPTILGNRYTVGLGNLSQAIGLMVAILGLNIATGYSGQLSLGHSFFVGSGAYLTAVLVSEFHWSYVATLGVVVPGLFVFGVLFGIPALRIQGLYLGLLTFAVAAVFPSIIRLDEVADRTGGSNGLLIDSDLVAPSWAPLDAVTEWLHAIPLVGSRVPDGLTGRQEEAVYGYFLLVVMAAVCFWLVRNILAGRVGRALVAVRDNPLGAAANGVNLAAYKTLSFGISAAVGGVAGTMLAMHSGFVGPDEFGFQMAILLIVGLIVGGSGTLHGPVVGGLAIQFVPHWSSQTQTLPGSDIALEGPYGAAILGGLLIAITFALPGGAAQGFRRLKARLLPVQPPPR